jgi:VanZ family protein
MNSVLLRAAPALLWMAMIFALSSRERFPSPPVGSAAIIAIFAHLFLYGMLAALLLIAFRGRRRITLRSAILAVAIATAYGVSDEFHQSFVPGRSATVFDVVVNFLGAVMAVTTVWMLQRRSTASAERSSVRRVVIDDAGGRW